MKVQFVAKKAKAKVNHVTEQRAANTYEKFTLSDSDSKNRSGEDVHAKAGIENLEKTIDLETKNHDFQT